MALWGGSCMQTFIYFFNNTEDKALRKLLVVWIWTMDTVHQCLLISGSYKGIVSGEVYLTGNVRTEFVIRTLFTSLVSVPAQAFFIYRIWKFAGRHWIIPFLGVPAMLFQLAEGAMIVDFGFASYTGSQVARRTRLALLIANFVVGASIDIIIAVTLSALLYGVYVKGRSKSTGTATLLHRLILFSIFTGMWTALVAFAAMTMLIIYPTNFIYAGFYFMMSPMYCNSLLANLNARPYLRSTAQDGTFRVSFALTRAERSNDVEVE